MSESLCPACGHPWMLHDDPTLPCRGVGPGSGYEDSCNCMAPIPEPPTDTTDDRCGRRAMIAVVVALYATLAFGFMFCS